ncbi:uncharacterized protein EI97DRAFT_434476 [Westerdykella ornata]|uniref:Uncharacterized protein n=1 Tax=Westerdykella ornata TaxID=318751 RepID=A0A6A6JFQ7_WESOR|nr:uncharacterized protein EI97DRAFT_434476 [Westerdykella ornata]KAF2275252.1 hypothetical protein EI97DRAFT_434476 [Westerdykella ornata]
MASLMLYRLVLQWSLVPTVLLFILSLACAGLTTFYWVAGDRMITRGIVLGASTARFMNLDWTATIVDYVSSSTDAAIISACLGGLAAVITFMAWSKLRSENIDTDYELPRRRLWVGLSLVVLSASFGSALASFILHFSRKGPDEYGCTTTLSGSDPSRTDRWIMCTREMAYCRALPMLKKFVEDTATAVQNSAADVRAETGVDVNVSNDLRIEGMGLVPHVCRMAQAVKWLQLLFMGLAATIAVLILTQSVLRRKTRFERVGIKKGKNVAEGSVEPDVRHVLGETWKVGECARHNLRLGTGRGLVRSNHRFA